MRKVIYTSLVGNHDILAQPEVIDFSYDYICFSNDIDKKKVGIWKIRKIPFECKDKTRESRYVKLLPHRVLSEYTYSLYIDANIIIKGQELYNRVAKSINDGSLIAQVNHAIPFWDCIYEEIYHAYQAQKVSFFPAYRQFLHLKRQGFPRHYGLFENNIILRKHNDPLVVKISEEWWNEYQAFSKRDQFSLMYIYWRRGYKADLLFDKDKCTRNVDFLETKYHENKTYKEKIKNNIPLSFCERLINASHRLAFRILGRFFAYNSF